MKRKKESFTIQNPDLYENRIKQRKQNYILKLFPKKGNSYQLNQICNKDLKKF